MKEYRVLVACGSGIATSTVIATRVSTRVPDTVKTPAVFAINYLTGMNKEATDAEILKIVKELDAQ